MISTEIKMNHSEFVRELSAKSNKAMNEINEKLREKAEKRARAQKIKDRAKKKNKHIVEYEL